MQLVELFEDSDLDIFGGQRSRESFDRMAAGVPKHAAFCFGRMNPPTIGHRALLEKTAESAMGGEYYIFASKSHDPKKNPLEYTEKLYFLKQMFPEFAQHIVTDPDIKTPLLAAEWLYQKGIRSFSFVAGSDRLQEYGKLMEAWNSPAVRAKANREPVYIQMISSGEREDGAEGLSGISASNARKAAQDGNFKTFMSTTGTEGKLAKKLYTAVRKGMGIDQDRSD